MVLDVYIENLKKNNHSSLEQLYCGRLLRIAGTY